jgi:hypothetical protein
VEQAQRLFYWFYIGFFISRGLTRAKMNARSTAAAMNARSTAAAMEG